MDGLSILETARILGVPHGRVKAQLSRAREQKVLGTCDLCLRRVVVDLSGGTTLIGQLTDSQVPDQFEILAPIGPAIPARLRAFSCLGNDREL